MPTASYHVLDQILGVLNVRTDDECGVVRSESDEAGMKSIIQQFIVPHIRSLNEESIQACKDSLHYYLVCRDDSVFEEAFASQQESPMPVPSEPRRFFLWIWEAMFPEVELSNINSRDWRIEEDAIRTRLRRKI
ncbi:hypothetical protein GC197_00465 [bacterium]|nr:hypothetical protein [bacterium]